MKKYIIVISIVIIILMCLFISIFLINKNNTIQMIDKNIQGETQKDITYEYCGWSNEKAEVLVLFTDTEVGISKIEAQDGTVVDLNGREKIAIDYAMDLNESYLFKMYNTNGEVFEKEIILDMSIIIYQQDEGYGYKKVAIKYINPTTESWTEQYKIGENGTWTTYSEAFYLWDYDLTYQNLVADDESITIYGRMVSQNGNIEEASLKIHVDTTITAKVDVSEAESLIAAVQSEDYSMGMYSIKVNDVTYDVHAYEFDKSQDFDVNTSFGIADDVATASSYAKRMVIIKVNGDLTIEQSKYLTTYRNSYGGTKGLLIYVTGSFTNNGTITMSARGAKAVGQNVYLWKNENESYEYVPEVGKAGGAGGRASGSQYAGATGGTPAAASNRATGGGGRWGWTIYRICWWKRKLWYIIFWRNRRPEEAGGDYGVAGAANGGAGGAARGANRGSESRYGSGGGAGNPGGAGVSDGYAGTSGTGGLLMVCANKLINNATIVSNGSAGGNAYRAGGGGSGGGSINLFYMEEYKNNGQITVNGGAAGVGYRSGGETASGGAGGRGTISIGTILTGTYQSTYKNY